MQRTSSGLLLACVVLGLASPAQAQYPGVERGAFYSESNRRNLPFNIYLPPDYHEGKDYYPVIYWLHGLLQDQNTGLRVTTYLHNAIAAGDLPPMILVLGTDGYFASTGYKDWPARQQYGEQAILELIQHIDGGYRTIADREARAIEGFSMGGLGAMYLGCKHLDVFCSALATAGAVGDVEAAAYAELNAKFLSKYTALKLVASTGDLITLNQNRWFSGRLAAAGIPHEYQVLSGAIHTVPSYYQRLGASTLAFHAARFYGR